LGSPRAAPFTFQIDNDFTRFSILRTVLIKNFCNFFLTPAAVITASLSQCATILRDGIPAEIAWEGNSDKSAREVFFYYTGARPSAVRYKNWKMYYTMVPTSPTGAMQGPVSYSWTMVTNIKRDPFEATAGLDDQKSATAFGGALASPSTAYVYDWNMLPLGQLLWLKELQTYRQFPPLQAPEAYNLDGIIAEVKASKTTSHAGE
jgi:hypothetical protein